MTTTLITGASSGIGAEMARQLADRGQDLALCARRLDRLEALREEILARHPDRRVAVRALDVTDDEAVFAVFASFRDELGVLDRVVVNAGLGKGAPLGTGRYDANRETAVTNFVAGLAQVEAAMEAFRAQEHGHLVVVSSMSAVRGLPRTMTAYAASKAGIAHLAEGLRLELLDSAIDVTVLYPGYVASEMNDRADGRGGLMIASTARGVRSMVRVMEARKASAYVPGLPWAPLSVVMRHAPLRLLRRLV